MNDSSVCQGDVLSLSCSADGNPAVEVYQLFENDVLVSRSNRSPLVWSKTASAGGVFVYRCVADNFVGTAIATTNVTVNGKIVFNFLRILILRLINLFSFLYKILNNTLNFLSLTVRPVIQTLDNITAVEGENWNLTCSVKGSPVPSLSWIEVRNGSRTDGNVRELINIRRSDAGEYKCEASNLCGNDVKITFLIVNCKG